MFLAGFLNLFSLLRQTLDCIMSALDAGVFVIFISFVGHLSDIPIFQGSWPGPRPPINVSATLNLDPSCLLLPSSSSSLRSSLSLFPITLCGPPLPSCSCL
ncbi:hypothetical protein BJY52DRAFT_270377 [Lactarius psammicola]|nr:hypothetical protein BJY52DRAFT_270377 [Lactarius psammicola]